jgi:hypothetical protein
MLSGQTGKMSKNGLCLPAICSQDADAPSNFNADVIGHTPSVELCEGLVVSYGLQHVASGAGMNAVSPFRDLGGRWKQLALVCSGVLIGFAVSGCERPYQRFIPISGDNSSFALDTKTGKKCLTEPVKLDLIQQAKETGYPFCIDLYKAAK